MKNIIICDLDGTLALIDHRRHLVEGEVKDWDSFYEACVDDVPNQAVIEVINSLAAFCEIWIVSGRSDVVSEKTLDWLAKHEVDYDRVFMRKKDDYTADETLKRRMLSSFPRERILCAFDDRDRVVKMWREEGITCFQVAPGNF